MADADHTLHEQLAALGWSSRPSAVHSCRVVYDESAALVGTLTASETWTLLRSRGLVAAAQHDDTAWIADGDTSERYYRNRRLVVMFEARDSYSWMAWGGGEYEPEADGEATSEAGARHKAEAWAEQGNGPASAAARLVEDYEVAS